MVSGKIFGFSASIIALVIAIGIVIRFGSGLKIGDRLDEGLQGLSGSFNSFFDSLLPQGVAQGTPKSIPNPASPKFIPSQDGEGSGSASLIRLLIRGQRIATWNVDNNNPNDIPQPLVLVVMETMPCQLR